MLRRTHTYTHTDKVRTNPLCLSMRSIVRAFNAAGSIGFVTIWETVTSCWGIFENGTKQCVQRGGRFCTIIFIIRVWTGVCGFAPVQHKVLIQQQWRLTPHSLMVVSGLQTIMGRLGRSPGQECGDTPQRRCSQCTPAQSVHLSCQWVRVEGGSKANEEWLLVEVIWGCLPWWLF